VADRSWEPGICDYSSLPRPGASEYWDALAHATYSYDPVQRILHSYDSVESVRAKCDYVRRMGLAGIVVWEGSGDVRDARHSRSLVRALYEGLLK
jgi:chitinase